MKEYAKWIPGSPVTVGDEFIMREGFGPCTGSIWRVIDIVDDRYVMKVVDVGGSILKLDHVSEFGLNVSKWSKIPNKSELYKNFYERLKD